MSQNSNTLAGFAVAVGLSVAGFAIYKGVIESRKADRFVTVKGLVERTEMADLAKSRLDIKVAGNDLQLLYQELEDKTKITEAFLGEVGFSKDDIYRGSPNVYDAQAREYGSSDNPENRFIISRTINVETADVKRASQLSGLVGELVRKGINLSSFYTTYEIERFNSLRPEMLSEAIKSAKEMAEQFSENSGSQLAGIRNANQGVMSIISNETDINKKLRVVSTVEFYIKG